MKRLLAVILLACPATGLATSVSEATQNADGSYALTIEGRAFIAWPRAVSDGMRAAAAARDAAAAALANTEKELHECQAVTSSYEKLRSDYVAVTDKYKALVDSYATLTAEYSTAANKLVALNNDYDKLVKQYDELAGKYRQLALRPAQRKTFDLGLGAINARDELRPIALAGIGTEVFSLELRGWLFGGTSSYGAAVGVTF